MTDRINYRRHDESSRTSAARRRSQRATSQNQSDTLRVVLWVAAGVALFVLLVSAVDAVASAGRIHPGVSVGGVALGGKMPSDAVAALKAELPAKAAAAPVTVTYQGQSWSVKASDIDASFDYVKLLDSAMSVGRSTSFPSSVAERLRAWFGGTQLPAPATADADKLSAEIAKVAGAIDVAPKDAVVKVSAADVTVRPSATGLAVDRADLQRRLLTAFTSNDRTLPVHVATAQPKISDAAAKAAQAIAEKLIDGPATVTYKGKAWTLSAAEVAKMVVFTPVETTSSPNTWVLEPQIGTAEASKTVVPKVGVALGTPPKDARFSTSAGGVTLIPSKDGVGPDIPEFAATLTSVLSNPSRPRTVELITKVTAPALTTDKARAMGIHTRISTFTTTYDGTNAPRTNNIHTLGAALDGKLVPPGATFSFNGYVGERTAAKGYQEAPAIVKGQLVNQLGGGICQVGTTMFNAVFFSGFPITERSNHSFYISHYPKGRDATVSWGGPDLKWKNPTQSWVLVSVSYSSDSITISLYGTDPGYSVSYTTGDFTNIVPFPIQQVADKTLQSGVKVVQDSGVDGKTVVVTRTVRSGSTVVRTDTFKSVYNPKPEVVQVGTAGAPAKSTTTSSTTKKS